MITYRRQLDSCPLRRSQIGSYISSKMAQNYAIAFSTTCNLGIE
ncbi:hypothetical protein [Microcoleus sp. FACHB-SPT15]|nr:hypothetical protein [Microcoleus sp. FACHB-SPT15]